MSGKLACRCTHQRAQVSAGVGKSPHGLGACIWMHLVNGTGNSPSLGRPTPGGVKQDKSSGGSVDTTKTRSDPQRVRTSSGERPIGAAKGKPTNTMASCRPPPPPPTTPKTVHRPSGPNPGCRPRAPIHQGLAEEVNPPGSPGHAPKTSNAPKRSARTAPRPPAIRSPSSSPSTAWRRRVPPCARNEAKTPSVAPRA